MIPSGGSDAGIQRFAEGLRKLIKESRFPSYRALARELHYSHEIISNAARGKNLPSLEVTLAFVTACSGDPVEWEQAWRALSRRETMAPPVASAWQAQPVADGADPEQAGCHLDAITANARKVSIIDQRHVIGEIELRYSPKTHTAWGRFKGYDGLDKLAAFRHRVDLVVGIVRVADNYILTYSTDYRFDHTWGDIVITGDGVYYAWVTILFDSNVAATGETDSIPLP